MHYLLPLHLDCIWIVAAGPPPPPDANRLFSLELRARCRRTVSTLTPPHTNVGPVLLYIKQPYIEFLTAVPYSIPLRPYRSADGAFNAALLLERGDPLSAIASAAGLPMFQEQQQLHLRPSSGFLSFMAGAGGPATATAPHCSPPAGGGLFGANGDDDGDLAVASGSTGVGQRPLWGNRPLALQMFQRAAELGHPEAMREVHRLRLRERIDHLMADRGEKRHAC